MPPDPTVKKTFFLSKRSFDQTFAPIYCYIIIIHSHEKYNTILLYTNILENEAKQEFTGIHMFTKFSFDSTNLLQPSDQATRELILFHLEI